MEKFSWELEYTFLLIFHSSQKLLKYFTNLNEKFINDCSYITY